MGRPEETVWWDKVTKLSDGRLSCKYCPKKFTGGVPRIKLHLSCRGGNIGPCKGVPSEIQEEAEEELGEDTSVGKVNRDKALQASPMKRRRQTSVGEHVDDFDVAETGETSYMPANVMPSPSSSIGVAALFQCLSSFFNNCESTTNRATQEYAADVPSFTRAEELQANLNLMNRARNTSVGKVKRDKALKASPMKRRRHTSMGEHSDGFDVAETGETNNMSSANWSLDMAALVQVPSSLNFLATTKGGSREYLSGVDSCMQEEALQANRKKQVRYPSIGGDSNGVNVVETGRTISLAPIVVEGGDTSGINVAVRGETIYTPATTMPSTSLSLEIAALPNASSSHINNCLSTENEGSQECVADVPTEIQDKAAEKMGGETSVGKVNRDKPLEASPMNRVRYTSMGLGGDSNGVNVYKTGETSNMPPSAMDSESCSFDLLDKFILQAAENARVAVKELPVHQRSDAVSSMVYEANARVRDPVYGCVGAISSLQRQIDALQTQLALAQAEVVHMKMRQFSASVPPSEPPTAANSPANNSSPPPKYMAGYSQARSRFSMDVVVDHASLGESLWSC